MLAELAGLLRRIANMSKVNQVRTCTVSWLFLVWLGSTCIRLFALCDADDAQELGDLPGAEYLPIQRPQPARKVVLPLPLLLA